MEALLSTLAFRRVPTVERARKRRKEEQDSAQVTRKRPKLLEDILSGENPPTLVPSYTSKGINMNKEKAAKWELAPIPLAGRDNIDKVVYWRRVGSPPATAPTDIPLHPTCIVEYTDAEYEEIHSKIVSWSKIDTDSLFNLCRKYNLRWPAIVGMFLTENSSANMETCQDHFNAVTHAILDLRSKHGYQRSTEEELLYCRSFERTLFKSHRVLKDVIFPTSSVLNDAERELEEQMDAITALLNRIGNVESSDGPSRYDNLDSVLTVAKEAPVYLKRTAGVSLRSARFDNKTAMTFFADNTQERLNAILCKLNVQIPRMATRRICDTLDRLKQDIVKLVMLRKYLAQNEAVVPSPMPMMYQNAETKKKRKSAMGYSGVTKSFNR